MIDFGGKVFCRCIAIAGGTIAASAAAAGGIDIVGGSQGSTAGTVTVAAVGCGVGCDASFPRVITPFDRR